MLLHETMPSDDYIRSQAHPQIERYILREPDNSIAANQCIIEFDKKCKEHV